jgi:O-antigen/teichoic acid export membrane protein
VKAAKGTLIYTAGNIIGSLAVLLLLVILARLLNPSAFGLYAIAIAFYNILASHYIFGVILRKELPNEEKDRKKASELIVNCYFVALLIALIIAVAAILSSGYIAVSIYHNPSLAAPLSLAGALVFMYVLFNILLATLIAVDRVKEGTIMYLIYAFVQLFASTALVLMGHGIMGAIAGLGVSLVVASAIGLYWVRGYLRRGIAGISRSVMDHILKFSAPVLTSSIATQAPPNLAILLLAAFATTAIVGNYNAAYRFGNFINVILLSMSYVLMPAFSKAFSDKKLSSRIGHIYNSSIYYTLLVLLPLLVYVVSVSKPLLYLLFSSEYTLAPLYFSLIAIGSAIGMLNTYASNLQVSYGDTKLFMYYQLLAVVIQVALLFALTPTFGAMGAIFALFIISQILINIVYMYALRRQFHVEHSFSQIWRLVIPSVLLLCLLYPLACFLHNSRWALAVNLVAIVLLFPILAALFGGVRRKNVDFLREIAKSLRIGMIAEYPIRLAELFVRS